jgi:hypothetical protein
VLLLGCVYVCVFMYVCICVCMWCVCVPMHTYVQWRWADPHKLYLPVSMSAHVPWIQPMEALLSKWSFSLVLVCFGDFSGNSYVT